MKSVGPLMTRRTALLGAIGVGGAVASWRLLAQTEAPAKEQLARAQWRVPEDREQLRIAQLLRRATFWVTPADLEQARHDGFARTLDRLLETPASEPASLVSASDPTKGAQLGLDELQAWWITHLLYTPNRFAERMTYFWHGHFTSDADKASVLFLYWQNLTWRRMAFGRFGEMLKQATADPAMLVYLDLADSDASNPDVIPNENYARELMELFSMGQGNYTEADVRAAARALAGWTAPAADRQVEAVTDPATGARETFDVWDRPKPGVFDGDRAYPGEVKFLGHRGPMRLDDIVGHILAEPVTARFMARKVAVQFIAAAPADSTVTELAGAFRSSGYDVRALVRAAFNSAEFAHESSYRSLVRTPLEFMSSAAVAVGAPEKDAIQLIVNSGDATGETLFQPPNVAGWPPNSRWISSSTILGRLNFISDLLDAVDPIPPLGDAVLASLDGALSPSTRKRLDQAASERERWMAVLASPEFNLK
jgi:uncharacterized protein (DUF1800 family)